MLYNATVHQKSKGVLCRVLVEKKVARHNGVAIAADVLRRPPWWCARTCYTTHVVPCYGCHGRTHLWETVDCLLLIQCGFV